MCAKRLCVLVFLFDWKKTLCWNPRIQHSVVERILSDNFGNQATRLLVTENIFKL